MSVSTASRWPEEEPTQPVPNVPSRELVRWSRVEALAQRAATILLATHDSETLSDVFRDLAEIRAIAGSVL